MKIFTTTVFAVLFLTVLNIQAKPYKTDFSKTPSAMHEVTDSFQVSGNCGMCKKTIESALAKVKGVSHSNWNVDTKTLVLTYNPHVVSLATIKQAVADSGYDTDTIKATDESYKSLPGCCQYER